MLPTPINGRWTLLLPEHRAARPEWTSEFGWERARLDHMRNNIGEGVVVVDVGTEEGDLSALYATWGAGVILVEPNPLVWPNVRAIFEANDLAKPLGWWAGFASDVDAHAPHGPEITDVDGWPSCAYGEIIGDHGFRNLTERVHDTPQAKVDTLVSRFSPGKVDVVTMDVEGAELRVLGGMTSILRQERPIVYVSVHPEFMAQMYGESPEDIDALMASFGYRAEHIATDHEVHMVYHP